MKWQKAYTLIEILVGLTIIGFLFGFGYVTYRDFSRRQALAGVEKQIQGDLSLTQELALAGQKPDTPACNSPNLLDSYGFKVYSVSEYKIEANCGNSSVINKDVILQTDMALTAPSPNPIKFKVLGQGTNIGSGSTASIVITQVSTGNSFTITINDAGEIK